MELLQLKTVVKLQRRISFIFLIYRLITTLGVTFDETKMTLESFVLSSISCSPKKLLISLLKHYTFQSLTQTYKIIGSLDFLGNPRYLLSKFSNSVQDVIIGDDDIGSTLFQLIGNTMEGV